MVGSKSSETRLGQYLCMAWFLRLGGVLSAFLSSSGSSMSQKQNMTMSFRWTLNHTLVRSWLAFNRRLCTGRVSESGVSQRRFS